MRPSQALHLHRSQIRKIAMRHCVAGVSDLAPGPRIPYELAPASRRWLASRLSSNRIGLAMPTAGSHDVEICSHLRKAPRKVGPSVPCCACTPPSLNIAPPSPPSACATASAGWRCLARLRGQTTLTPRTATRTFWWSMGLAKRPPMVDV